MWSNSNTYGYANGITDSNSNAYRNADAYVYADANGNGYLHADCHADRDAHSYGYRHGDGDGYRHGNPAADPDAEVASDSGTSPNAVETIVPLI
jgi:hypothetical protein